MQATTVADSADMAVRRVLILRELEQTYVIEIRIHVTATSSSANTRCISKTLLGFVNMLIAKP